MILKVYATTLVAFIMLEYVPLVRLLGGIKIKHVTRHIWLRDILRDPGVDS